MQYTVVATSSGWAVRTANGELAEFLSADDAHEAKIALESGAAEERDYEWVSE